ncbi:putative LRR receptor-like serine/threonine-protein kinase [Raphanus sativus]|nr:putative LRR receptor-like serine/threonine-protein kinase [Raphanus sativus]
MAWQMFMIIVLVDSQNPNGFINVDCGLSGYESPYTELMTRLTYTTDADLVESRESGRIDKIFETMYPRPYWTVRSFPKPERNCYKINTERETKYLIRATFLYGNYDGRNTVPSFDLYLGPNLWTMVEANSTTMEVIHHTASQSSLQICLVNTGSGTPFINVLELRPLNLDAYTTPSGSLKMLFRWYLGNPDGGMIRYPSDVYDRYWYPPSQQKHLIPITTTLNVDTKNDYNPPETVMATAATPRDANASWTVEWIVEPPNTQCYPYVYFSELQTLGANETREFTMFLAGADFHSPISPGPLITTTIFDRLPTQCDGKCVLELTKTSTSTLPPVLSAIEVYTVMDFPLVETNEDDVTGIKDVQGTYELNKLNWQGDPCTPRQFLWEGLKCDHSDNSTRPTIITLDLSSSGLTGVIAEAIRNLAHLQHLDLSNNSLSGGVPEFLADMSSLLVINLSSNNLSGSVPQTLAQKKRMKLNVEGNPLLICTTGTSCVNKQGKDGDRIKNVVIAVVVASLALLIITALLILFLYRHKRRPSVVEGPRSNMQELDDLPLPIGIYSEISL